MRAGARARRDEPARRPGVGRVLRHPDLRLHARRPRDGGVRRHPRGRGHPARRARAPTCASRPRRATRATSPQAALVFLLARAFSSGCAALTGVEAISNGVPAFRKPKSSNAATTLLLLGAIAVTMMMSIIILARRWACSTSTRTTSTGSPSATVRRCRPATTSTRSSRRSPRRVFDNFPPGFYFVVAMTGHHPDPRRQHRVQRLPGARARSWPRTASRRASWARAVTGSPTATAS